LTIFLVIQGQHRNSKVTQLNTTPKKHAYDIYILWVLTVSSCLVYMPLHRPRSCYFLTYILLQHPLNFIDWHHFHTTRQML